MTEPEIIPPTDARRTRPDNPLDGYRIDVPVPVQMETRRRVERPDTDLLPIEARFATAYLTHGNGKRAMEEAGYPTTSRALAAQLLEKPAVAALIEEQLDAVSDLYRLTHARLIAEHGRIAFSTLADYEEVLRSDHPIEEFNALPRSVRSAVKRIKYTTRTGRGDDDSVTRTLEFELHDKGRSLDALAKITNLYSPPEEEIASAMGDLIRAAAKKLEGKV